nr:MAG TPA: hypothetical protein [Caudoviricetes sp.]
MWHPVWHHSIINTQKIINTNRHKSLEIDKNNICR